MIECNGIWNFPYKLSSLALCAPVQFPKISSQQWCNLPPKQSSYHFSGSACSLTLGPLALNCQQSIVQSTGSLLEAYLCFSPNYPSSSHPLPHRAKPALLVCFLPFLPLFWGFLVKIWQCRNTQTHGADQEIQDKLKREHASYYLHPSHQQSTTQPSSPWQRCFRQSNSRRNSIWKTSSITTWLRLTEPTLQRCLHDAQDKLATHQTDIRTFFDEASYCNLEASDTTLSYDTLDTSGTIDFSPNSSSDSTHSSTSSFDSDGTDDSGTDGTYHLSPLSWVPIPLVAST